MTERPIGVNDRGSVSGANAEFRTRERSVGGNTVAEQYLIYEKERQPNGAYGSRAQTIMYSTFRTTGVASAGWIPIVIAGFSSTAIFGDPFSEAILVALRELTVIVEGTAVRTSALVAELCTCNLTSFTGGTQLSGGRLNTDDPWGNSAQSWAVYGATASDGGVATTIASVTSVVPIKKRFASRLHTAAADGMTHAKRIELHTSDEEVIRLDSGVTSFSQGLCVRFPIAPVTTDFVIVNCVLEQFVK